MNEPAAGRLTINRVKRIFIESLGLNIRENEVADEGGLNEVAGMDSIAMLEFIAAVEREFGIEIEPEFLQLDFVSDLPRLASYLEQRTGRPHESKA